MAIRVATMSPMDTSSPAGKPQHLPRKLVLLLLLTSAYALGLVLLFRKRPDFPLILFSYFADCTLAVVAGLGARLVLSKRNWFIRSTAAIVIVTAGQVILGYFTQWKIGLDVPQLLIGYLSWVDLSHLVLGLLAALSAVWAWHRSRPNPELDDFSAPVMVTPLHSHSDLSAQPRIRLPQSWSLHLGSNEGV